MTICSLYSRSLRQSLEQAHIKLAPRLTGTMQVDFDPRLVNSVGLLGRLGTPFQLRRINDKYTVATSALAVSRGPKKDGQEPQTDW